MNGWLPIKDAPHGEEVMLWLKTDLGSEEPIGVIIGRYQKTDHWEGFCEKSAAGSLNLGLRQDLITHFKLLDGGPGVEETF